MANKSNGWKYWLVIVGLLMMVIAYFVHDRNKLAAELDSRDSTHFDDLRRIQIDKARDLNQADQEKRDLKHSYEHLADSLNKSSQTYYALYTGVKAQRKPVNVVVASDTAEIRRQIDFRDQAIDFCDSTLSAKGAELSAAKAFQDSLQAIEAKRDTIQEKAITALNAAAWDNAKRAEKLGRRLDNPWSFGLHAGYGVTLNNGQVLAGPQAGAGVQYKIRIRRKR